MQQTSLSKYLCSRILSLYLVWGEFSPHISEVARLVCNLISSESSLSPSSSPALLVSCVVKVLALFSNALLSFLLRDNISVHTPADNMTSEHRSDTAHNRSLYILLIYIIIIYSFINLMQKIDHIHE